MNLTKTLLILLDIFFALMLVVFIAAIGFIFYMSFFDELPFYIVMENSNDEMYYEGFLGTLFQFISYSIFIGIIYYLRKGIRGMVKQHFFDIQVSKNLNMAGVLLTVVSIATIAVNFFKDIFNGILKLGTGPLDWNSKIFMVIIGLFLMLMARVIKEGVELKSENELTI